MAPHVMSCTAYPDWDITDFDLSPDASEVVLERSQTRSNIALVELPRPPGR